MSPAERFNRILRSKGAGVCLFLGFEDDQNLHASYASHSNRCFGQEKTSEIEHTVQQDFCLSRHYDACPVYLTRVAKDISCTVPETLKRASEWFLRGEKD